MDKQLIRERIDELLEKVENSKEFVKGLEELLESHVDLEATENYRRIIPKTGKFHGVPIPVLRVIAAEVGKFIQKESIMASALLRAIWSEGSFEARQIVGKSLEKFGPENPRTCLDFVSSVLPDLDNWAVCDNLAMFGVEPIMCSNPELVLPLSVKWVESENKWIRRFGVVTLRGFRRIPYQKKFFEILNLVMKDEESDVRKAVSWILRFVCRDQGKSGAIFKYLLKWAKNKPSKATRMLIKDGMKKLPREKQNEILSVLGG